MACNKVCCLTATCIIGAVLLVAAIVLTATSNLIYDLVLKNQLSIEEGNLGWDRFEELPIPVQFKVHVFNLTNPDEFVSGEKPIVDDIGPYVYSETRKKENITRHGDHLTYNEFENFEFDRELTPEELSDSDAFRTINPAMLAIYQIVELSGIDIAPDLVEFVISTIFENQEILSEYRVNDLLFEGTKFCDPEKEGTLAKLACFLIMVFNFKIVHYREDLSMKYSLFRHKNVSDTGLMEINSGTNDMQKIGQIYSVDGQQYTDYWNGDECNKVHGTDGTVYAPHLEKSDVLVIYNADICRTANAIFDRTSHFRDVDTYRYKLDDRIFIEDAPEESCYCLNVTRDMEGNPSCFLDGTAESWSCLGIPALFSFPHFLNADEKYIQGVDGLSPDESLHSSFIDVEPFSGTPTSGEQKVQVNMVARPMFIRGEVVPISENLPRSVFPILWITETVALDNYYYDKLYDSLLLKHIADIMKWVLIGVFGVMTGMAGGAAFYYRRKRKNSDSQIVLTNE